jgi:hypothetical protein
MNGTRPQINDGFPPVGQIFDEPSGMCETSSHCRNRGVPSKNIRHADQRYVPNRGLHQLAQSSNYVTGDN